MEWTTDKLLAWITAGSFLTSIILTSITIFISYLINNQNKQLQKEIHNRDIKFQYRHDILSIYNVFMEAMTILKKRGSVAYIFTHEQSCYDWSHEIHDAMLKMYAAYNRANLILNDKELMNYLLDICKSYDIIVNTVTRYIGDGTHLSVIKKARSTIKTQFGIELNDCYSMDINCSARDCFIKLCDNGVTQLIEERVQELSNLLNAEKFNSKFKKYILLTEIE